MLDFCFSVVDWLWLSCGLNPESFFLVEKYVGF